MKVAIVGGGITGLTTAYELVKKSHQVTVFEKEKYLGGLAAGFREKNWQWSLERFYHHLFPSDYHAQNLISELGLQNRLRYYQPKTSIFRSNRISAFDSPLALMTFPHLSWPEKIRAGLVTAYLKASKALAFEQITAEKWLRKYYGQTAYQTLWQPLLQSKFGSFSDEIAMSWFGARIKKRSRQLGYLHGGFQVLINRLAEEIKSRGGKIMTNTKINNLNKHLRGGRMDSSEVNKFNKVIITTPTPEFLRIAPLLPVGYRKQLQSLKFIGALNLVLVLKEKFLTDNTYWLNINEPNFPFVAVVEHTNFINRRYYDNAHLLYVGGYYPQNHPFFRLNEKQIFQKFLPYLQKINPKLNSRRYMLYANKNAQPIIPINYSQIMPAIKTPVKNLYLANQSLIYPWDRGVNYAIEVGKMAAGKI